MAQTFKKTFSFTDETVSKLSVLSESKFGKSRSSIIRDLIAVEYTKVEAEYKAKLVAIGYTEADFKEIEGMTRAEMEAHVEARNVVVETESKGITNQAFADYMNTPEGKAELEKMIIERMKK